MGRIKTRLIKRITLKLYNDYRDKFEGDFESNKKTVEQLTGIESMKVRNAIAGYLTRLLKERKE